MNFPADLKYTKDHEWIRVEGDVAYVGITDYAQGELGRHYDRGGDRRSRRGVRYD